MTQHVHGQDEHGNDTVNGIPIAGSQIALSVKRFNEIGQIVPPGRFNADRVGFYTGMQLEELGETLMAIAEGCLTLTKRHRMTEFAKNLKAWGMEFKQSEHLGAVLRSNREELLDGGIDVAVVTLGSLFYQTPAALAAISTVLLKNAEKCPGGIATHDANGKIIKPQGWTKPNLLPFVDHYGE